MSESHVHEHPLHDAPVPRSSGMPLSVRVLIFGSLFLVLMQGIFTVVSSDFGRIWPSGDSAKIPLK
jgi:hypothetical protein